MPRVEGGFHIDPSKGTGPRNAEHPVPPEEARRTIEAAQIANQQSRDQLGLNSTARRVNWLDKNGVN